MKKKFLDAWKWYTIQISVAPKFSENTTTLYMIYPGYFSNLNDSPYWSAG